MFLSSAISYSCRSNTFVRMSNYLVFTCISSMIRSLDALLVLRRLALRISGRSRFVICARTAFPLLSPSWSTFVMASELLMIDSHTVLMVH